MAFIVTFLGKGGTGRTTLAIAGAKQLAAQGKRVLLASQDTSPALSVLLGLPVGSEPQEVGPNLQVVQLQSTGLLEQNWEELKTLEAQYLRSPFFKAVYGQELGILPGMDDALALDAIRRYDGSNQYDAIVFDGAGNQATLRMFSAPEVTSWYVRRFRQVFVESDLGKTIAPFVQPIAAAVLNVNWSGDLFAQPGVNQATSMLEQGRAAVADPNRVAAYLVTTSAADAVATAKYLWGSAQQAGLTVNGVLVNQISTGLDAEAPQEFAPLSVHSIPARSGDDWQSLIQALPDLSQTGQAPQPIRIDVAERKVYLFLPGFDKKQVKLTQYGPEITIEAGNQRRNISLPSELRGRQVTGAKFQDSYLIISL
jgi:anion-transporting  ArsA/GET3 family ATPase